MEHTRGDPAPLAALLAADPTSALPDPLPVEALQLAVAIHALVAEHMGSDIPYARQAAERATQLAARFPDHALVQAQAHWSRGSAVFHLPDYAQALAEYERALEWYERARAGAAPAEPARDIRVVQIMRLACLSEMGRYQEAREAEAAAVAWADEHASPYARLTLLLNRSHLAGALGDYEATVALADATIAMGRELGDPARVAQAFVNRGHALGLLGRFDEAEAAYVAAEAAASEAEDTLTLARIAANRAWLLRCQGRLFAALSCINQAAQGFAGLAVNEQATIALEEATVYEQLGQLPEALRSAAQAAQIYHGLTLRSYSADAGLFAARVAARIGNLRRARALLDEVRARLPSTPPPALAARLQLAEGSVAVAQGPEPHGARRKTLRNARRGVAQAQAALQEGGLVVDLADAALLGAQLDAYLGAEAEAAAALRRLIGHPSPAVALGAEAALGRLLPPAEALPHLRRATELAVAQRRLLPTEELQARYGSEALPHFTRLGACLLALGQADAAAEAICAAKAGPILDLRAARASLDPARQQAINAGRTALARLREQVFDHRRKVDEAQARGQREAERFQRERLCNAEEELQQAEHALVTLLRVHGDRAGFVEPPPIAAIQAGLGAHTVGIEYARLGDELIGICLAPARPPELRRLGPLARLDPLLDQWHLARSRLGPAQEHDTALGELRDAIAPFWELLLAPWADRLRDAEQLVVAPFDRLCHVPWAALHSGDAWLGERLTISVTPGLALATAPYPYFGRPVGPPLVLGAASTGQRHLPLVAAELRAIAGLLPEAVVLEEATSADLRARPSPALLHIAAHGYSDPKLPLCSTIELADGPFLLFEAHRLDLSGTALVVLSACDTSVHPEHGDMALALAGAFLCAGARAVVASLWPVADTATAALMAAFYQALADGHAPAAALRRAQAATRDRYALDWAAFQLWAGAPSV